MVGTLIDPKKKEAVQRALEKGDLSLLAGSKPAPDANGSNVSVGVQGQNGNGTSSGGNALNRAAAQKRHWGVCLRDSAEKGNTAGVQEALSKGADINERDPRNGKTALMYAAESLSPDIIDILIKNGADPNRYNDGGDTAIMLAIFRGHGKANSTTKVSEGEVFLKLIEAGTNLEIANSEGDTAINLAVEKNALEAVRILLENGADANPVNPRGISPLQRAMHQSRDQIAELLRKYGAR